MKINKVAFTLAEILITLGIIGVVAAMTIPALMNQANDVELKNKFKKEYSVFSQAILQIQTDNGGDLTNALTNMSSAEGAPADSQKWRDLLATKVTTIKNCDPGVGASLTYGGCFGSSYKYFASASDPFAIQAWIDTSVRYSGVMSDGASYSVYQSANGNTCSTNFSGKTNACSALTIDVNGVKGPNKFGKDMYGVEITNTGLITITQYGDDCGGGSGNGFGIYCAAKVLLGVNY